VVGADFYTANGIQSRHKCKLQVPRIGSLSPAGITPTGATIRDEVTITVVAASRGRVDAAVAELRELTAAAMRHYAPRPGSPVPQPQVPVVLAGAAVGAGAGAGAPGLDPTRFSETEPTPSLPEPAPATGSGRAAQRAAQRAARRAARRTSTTAGGPTAPGPTVPVTPQTDNESDSKSESSSLQLELELEAAARKVQFSASVEVPTGCVGRLIGTAGVTIKRLEAESGCQVRVLAKAEGCTVTKVAVGGPTESAVACACAAVRDIAASFLAHQGKKLEGHQRRKRASGR
jgi:hypothetical protein